MEILVFLFVISHLNLVLTDDNVAIDPAVTHKNTYKVHPDPKDMEPQNDQIAESSEPVSQIYGREVEDSGQKEAQDETQNHIQIAVAQLAHDDQNLHQVGQQHEAHLQEGLRQEGYQTVLNQGFTEQPQQIYVHQYPVQQVQILDAEASPLQQAHGNHQQVQNQKTLGYSSYVEHVSHKDEEEINSALQEGSVSDIKRLVPKSEISFKIYKNDKTLDLENQKPEIQTNLLAQTQQKAPAVYQSTLHHRVKSGGPAAQVKTAFQQTQKTGLEGLQQTWQQQQQQQTQSFENSQQLLQSAGKTYSHDQQSVNAQTVYYTQPEVNTQRTFFEINGKSSSAVKPHFKIHVDANNYGKPTSTVEFNSVAGSKDSKQGLADITNLQYQKLWNFGDSKTEGSQKLLTNTKPLSTVHYDVDPVAQRGVHYTQTHPTGAVSHIAHTNFNKQKIASLGEKNTKIGANFVSNSYVAKGIQNNFAGHFPTKIQTEQKVPHVLNYVKTGNYFNGEALKTGQNQIIGHLGATAFGGAQAIKTNQHFGIHSYPDSEPAKTEHGLLGQLPNSFIDIKNSQNNFDHQKALEGSTSFDIKNAIDNNGNLVHQTNYITPTTEAHPFVDIQKQQLAYVIPKIPNSAVLIDNSIHESQALEAHQIKDFGQAGISSPQLSYHAISSPDVSGKFFHQPQAIVLASEHLKPGNTLTANDLQHSLIKVQLPKEEIYQQVKTPNIQLPATGVSHIAYQKQPYVIHYDGPALKYPQEIHFQPKTKIRIQNPQPGHIKLAQPLTIDWSLFKTAVPNVQTLAVKPELTGQIQDGGKKIVPILVRKRKNRSNSNQEIGIVYGKVNNNRRPLVPTHRQEKTIRVNLLPEASNNVNQFEPKGDRKNEFSVSASYKVDRSFKTNSS